LYAYCKLLAASQVARDSLASCI